MRAFITSVMEYCKTLGVDYADIRLKDIAIENIVAEDGQVQVIETDRSQGAGIRVYVEGAMGFAATSDLAGLKEAAQKAYDTALASRTLQIQKINLSPKEAAQGHYATPCVTDPFTVSLRDKLDILLACEKTMRQVDSGLITRSFMSFRKEDVVFADTDGSYITQVFYQSEGGINARAVSDSDMQARSYGNVVRAGFEAILDMRLPENAERIARESVALINAEDCPSGVYDLILTPKQLMLQIHESVGHPTELDRVLGSEAAFAGMSFVTTDYLKKTLQYGSEHVTIVADGFSPLGLGSFGYDDEGVPAQQVTLVDKGVFKNYLTSRDNAPVVNQASHGMGLADGWQNIPIVRMTNINLLPGDDSLEDLIAGVEDGFLLDENKSWSIDDKRINFQFACEIAWEIKKGKRTGRIFKNPIYAGKTTEFWGSCDGVCGADEWKIIGVPNCGKGQPMQIMRVAHGSAPARFRNVKVGVSDVK